MFHSAVERRLFVIACRYRRDHDRSKGGKIFLRTWKDTVRDIAKEAKINLRPDFEEYLVKCLKSGDIKWLDS